MTTLKQSPSETRKRSCFTTNGKPKLRFNTRAEAKQWARQLLQKYPENKILSQYRCEHCGYFHNGEYPADESARAGKRSRHHPE